MAHLLIKRFVPNADALSPGTIIILNTETGDYLTAQTEDEAFDAFGLRFGWGVSALVHKVR